MTPIANQYAMISVIREGLLRASGYQRPPEELLDTGDRRAFVPVQDLLKRDPHLEMHTRGG